jgi:hypothetical protein
MLQTIANTFSESGDLESSYTSEQYTIQPEKGKFLKNIKTGEITSCIVCVNKKDKLKNYIEIDNPNTLEIEYLDSI